MSDTDSYPRVIVHQKILERANSRPKASIDDLAADVSGATPALVSRVFEEHGDSS